MRTTSSEPRPSRLPIIRSGTQFGNLRAIPTDPTVEPPFRRCFSCWRDGHRLEQFSETNGRFCFNCGRCGTDLAECPRCSEPHRREWAERAERWWDAAPTPTNSTRRTLFDEEEREDNAEISWFAESDPARVRERNPRETRGSIHQVHAGRCFMDEGAAIEDSDSRQRGIWQYPEERDEQEAPPPTYEDAFRSAPTREPAPTPIGTDTAPFVDALRQLAQTPPAIRALLHCVSRMRNCSGG